MQRKALAGLLLCFLAPAPCLGAEPAGMPLREALVLGITRNLDLAATRLNVPIRDQDTAAGQAVFDPLFSAQVYSGESKSLTGGILTGMEYERNGSYGAAAGISKRFETGMDSSLSLETGRTSNNSLVDALDPNYRTRVVLNLTQPLLRDFGGDVNTATVRIAGNRTREAALGVLDAAQRTGLAIENAYWSLSAAQAVVLLRIQSRDLASDLVAFNAKSLEKGLVTVTAKAQAESAAAAREEQVILARQQAGILENQLKDMLEIRAGDVLFSQKIGASALPPVAGSVPARGEAAGQALEKRPDLAARRLAIADQDIRVAYLENQKHPRLDVVATLGANGLSGGDRPATLFGPPIHSVLVGGYGDSWDTLADVDGYEWKLGLRLSQPLGNRAAMARARQAAAEKTQAVYAAKRLEGTVETEVANALVEVDGSRERVRVAGQARALAARALAQEMKRLEGGLSDSFHVLQFQDDLVAAQIREVQALADHNKGLAALYRAMGQNLSRYGIEAE